MSSKFTIPVPSTIPVKHLACPARFIFAADSEDGLTGKRQQGVTVALLPVPSLDTPDEEADEKHTLLFAFDVEDAKALIEAIQNSLAAKTVRLSPLN